MTDATNTRRRWLIDDAQPADVVALHAINEAATPGVGSVTREEMSWLVDVAHMTLVARGDDGLPAGFILLMTEGLAYDSLNYAWVTKYYPAFAYCDRIAVDADTRGSGLGRQLYEAAFARLAGVREKLLCEVNLEPPNPGSLRFHRALGFQDVGQRWLDDRSKGVVYLEMRI